MAAQLTEKTALPPADAGPVALPAPVLQADLVEISENSDFGALIGDGAHLVFQSAPWLAAWFLAMQNKQVLARYWLTFRNADGETVMGLPLVLRQEGRLRVIEMPDCGVSDYLSPVFYRPAANGNVQVKAFWAQLKAVLPPADLLRFEGLKRELGEHSNPLIRHPLAVPNRQCGWKKHLPEAWDDYFASLPPRMRENLGKARRRFLRQPGARMAIAATGAEALGWLDHLDRMQSERLADRGVETQVTSASFSHFYRKLAETGIENGTVIMAGLFAEGEVVALNFAVRKGDRATYLRIANIFGPWSNMSPGLLVTEHIIQHLHATGVRIFDFGLGEYDYKKRFGAEPFALVDLAIPLSMKGFFPAAEAFLKGKLRNSELVRRLTGRKSLKS